MDLTVMGLQKKHNILVELTLESDRIGQFLSPLQLDFHGIRNIGGIQETLVRGGRFFILLIIPAVF
jgi:hypothetical protein